MLFCILEDETFEAVFDIHDSKNIPTQKIHVRDYSFVKLRVKTCGHAIVILEDEGSDKKTMITVMNKKLRVTRCEYRCDNTVTYDSGDDTYNSKMNDCKGK